MGYHRRNRNFWTAVLCLAAVFVSGMGTFLAGADFLSARVQAEGAKKVQSDISRACVQCYAIEGRYPPSLLYLQDHYRVFICKDQYTVFYDGFASNLMPDILVLPSGKTGKAKKP